jgi:ubiquinone/menaquinone biosynthesis C-methylase UbiE
MKKSMQKSKSTTFAIHVRKDGTQYCGQEGYDSAAHRKEFLAAIKGIDVRHKKVLDVGAGEGWCGKEFEKRGARVIMTDLYPPNRDVLKMDMTDLKFRNGSFDVVNCHGSLHHVKHPAAAVREISRVLKKGGIFVMSCEAKLKGGWLRTRLNRYLLQYIVLRITIPEEWRAHGRNYLSEEYDFWCRAAGLEKKKEGVYVKI